MKGKLIIQSLVMFVLVLVISGCTNKPHTTGNFKAQGVGDHWDVTAYYELKKNHFTEYAVFTYTGSGSVKGGEFEWDFPKELGMGSWGTLPPQNKFETPRSGGSSGELSGKPLSFYQDHIDQTSLWIQWEDEYGNHEEVIDLSLVDKE